jgi:hypothetical protein
MERAACVGTAPDKRSDPDAVDPFFPEKGQPLKYGQIFCFTCPVRAECDDYRERTDSKHGMWGGEMVKRKKKGA